MAQTANNFVYARNRNGSIQGREILLLLGSMKQLGLGCQLFHFRQPW